jgi:GNAT superfamily N-acetyltransferase
VPLAAPEPLADAHQLAEFDSGVASLDDWLRRRARGNQTGGARRTFVVAEGSRVIAYYAVAAGGISPSAALGRFRRNMPDPIPVALLARLAIDRAWQGRGLGRAMVRDCAARIAHAGDSIGIRGIVVHAISDQARGFYLALGFEPSPLDPMLLMVTLSDVRAILGMPSE